MLRRATTISSGQLFTMLTVFRLVIMLTEDSLLLGGRNLIDNIVSCGIALAMNFVLVLPVYFLNKQGPGSNILEKSFSVSRILGGIVCVFYAIYFVGVDCYYLAFFQVLTTNVLDPEVPAWLASFAIMAVAVYAAYKGLEAIARVSGIVLVILGLGLVLILGMLVPEIDPQNFPPFFYEGGEQTFSGMIQFLSRSTGIATMALILPQVSGNRKLGFTVWSFVIYAFMAVTITILVGALGEYSSTQLFPFYAAASMAQAGPFQRVNSAFIGIWVIGLFVKLAIDVYLSAMCVSQMCKNSRIAWRVSIVSGGVAVAVASALISMSREAYQAFFGLRLLLPFRFTAAVVLPVVVLIAYGIKQRGRKKCAQLSPENQAS